MTAVIGACVRNQEKTIGLFRANSEQILDALGGGSIAVYESGSNDQTRPQLVDWSLSSKRVHIFLDNARGIRTERLSQCRNALLTYAMHKKCIFFIAIDSDYTLPIDIPQLVAATTRLENRTAAFAASHPYIYDVWATRHSKYQYRDPFRDGFFTHLFQWPLSVSPLEEEPVLSGFNGIGIYNMRLISKKSPHCRYKGRYDDEFPICEHAAFHYCLHKTWPGTRMYIDGRLVATNRPGTIANTFGVHYLFVILLCASGLYAIVGAWHHQRVKPYQILTNTRRQRHLCA